MKRILVTEFLLADATAWSVASDSMRREARAMLTAVVTDLASSPEVAVSVLLSALSLENFNVPSAVQKLSTGTAGLLAWLINHETRASEFDASLVIAPESDGCLTHILECLNRGDWQAVCSLNVQPETSRLFSDKFATFQWLSSQGFQTPATILASQMRLSELPETHRVSDPHDVGNLIRTRLEAAFGLSVEQLVLKPRFGAGSDLVQIVIATELPNRLQDLSHELHNWIIQPFVRGEPCSIGLIAGPDLTPLPLPPARQHIARNGNHLSWAGGSIPLQHPHADQLVTTAECIAERIEPFAGYIGIDAVLSPDANSTDAVSIIEINPRLCTSIVGYLAVLPGLLCDLVNARPEQQLTHAELPLCHFNATGLIAGRVR